VAEAAYDEVVNADQPSEAEAASEERARDSFGRFIARPGEADDGQPSTQPRDDTAPQPPDQKPHPAPEGSSSEAPNNWSAQDRLTFSKLAPEGREFLLRRHSEMEGDYQRRVQATAQAASFVQSLAPVFSDPIISGSLQQAGLAPSDAVREWAAMHRRAMSPNPNDRVGLLFDLAQRMGIDPAAMAPSRQGPAPQLSQADMQDPAIRYFADHLGRTVQDMQALRGQLSSMQQHDAERQNAEALKVTRWGIDSFAEEQDANGHPLRPDFDLVLPQIIELFRANPDETSERPTRRQDGCGLTQGTSCCRRRDPASSRSIPTSGPGRPSGAMCGVSPRRLQPADPQGSRSLRDVIEQSAEEVGF
jgi:hypothetical protein